MSPYVSPKDKTYLTVEITFSKNDSIDLMDENNLIELITNQVEEVGLINKNKFIAGSSNKELIYIYPIMYTGYQEELSKTKVISQNMNNYIL